MSGMTIKEFCDRHGACREGREWAMANCETMADVWAAAKPGWLMWVATRPGVLGDREIRRFAVWSARQVQQLMTDARSLAALDVAERYTNGEATDEELAAAGAAAWAARSAAWAARSAAEAAAWSAAEAAAGAAAEAAAWSAAEAAAWSAAEAARSAAEAAAWAAGAAAWSAAEAAAWAAGAAAWSAAEAAAGAAQSDWIRAYTLPNFSAKEEGR
jgi:hypothetical protein